MMVDQVDELTGAIVKGLYEGEPSAFTDALFTKLAGIEANATADQTGPEIVTLLEALIGAARLDATAIKNLPAGGTSTVFDNPAAIGVASVEVARSGGASTVVFGGSAATGYTLTPVADTFIEYIHFDSTSNAVVNGSGELVIIIDNAAVGRARPIAVKMYDNVNNTEVDPQPLGLYPSVVIAGTTTTITIPNVAGNFGSGISVYLN